MHLLLRWIVSAVALLVTVFVGRSLGLQIGFMATGDLEILKTALEAALVIGLLNAFVRPIVKFIALPITCLTLGLFSLVINAGLFSLTPYIVHGFRVIGFLPALFGSIVMSIISGPLNWLVDATVEKKRDG